MSYRIEIAKQGRAGCQNTACKAQGIKIQKGEFRFGTWVEMEHGASFRWKHWGCVTGFQLQNLREYLKQGDPDGEYQWDFMDGLDEVPDEYKDKLKTAVIEGKIADEDWKGDPAYNVLGQKGTAPRAKKAKKPAGGEEEDAEGEAPAPAPKKRGRGKKAEDSDEEDAKPAPKRAKKAKKEEPEADSKPAVKKERRKRATKKEESDEDVKGESDDEVMPTRGSRSRRSTKKEESADELGMEDEAKPSIETKPVKKSRAKKVKQEAANGDGDANGINGTKKEPKEETTGIKPEPEADDVVDMPEKTTKPRAKKGKREAVKKEEPGASLVASKVKNEDEEVVDVKPKRGKRAKKEEAQDVKAEEDADEEAEVDEGEKRGKKRVKAEPTEEVKVAGKTRARRSRG